ncbi:MAG TPA: MFS transporter [Clostridiales bacterium]|nr:MFS transporter [Clostridiales bacterium]
MNDIKRFHKDMILLFLAELLWPLGLALYSSFFPIHIKELGGSDIVVGIIMSIPPLMGVLAIVGGIWADFDDRRNVIIFGWAITIPAPLIWAFATSWQWMLIGQIIYALTWVCSPAITLYILDYDTTGNKIASYTMVYLAAPIGSILAPAIGGKIASSYGRQTLYLIVFILYSVSTLCTLLLSKQPVQNKEKNVDECYTRFSIKNKLSDTRDSIKQLAGIITFLTILVSSQNIGESFLSLYMNEFRNISVENIGLSFTALFAGASLFTFLFGKSDKKISSGTALNTGNIIFIISALLVCFTQNSISLLVLAFFLRGINRSIVVFTQVVLAKNINNENNKGFILSLYIAVRSILIGLVTYPGAALYRINPAYPFYAEALLVIIWMAVSYNSHLRNRFINYE